MRNVLEAGDAGERRPIDHTTCNDCGGVARPLPILDSREGKNYRLFRCLGCEKVCWSQEKVIP